MIIRVWVTAAIILACLMVPVSATTGRVKLAFSLDQGFSNGIVAQGDRLAVVRICRALRPLAKRYDIYVVVNPQIKDKVKLTACLDTLAALDMPFILDVYSSDSMTLGSCCEADAPHDASHGISASMEELTAYKKRYGNHMAGLRFMEIFAQDFTVEHVRTTNPEWARPCWKMPVDSFYRPDLAEGLIRFAAGNGMFVQWSEWHTLAFAPWDDKQKAREESAAAMIRKYPGVVILTYANNEPNGESAKRLDTWDTAVKGLVKKGALGFGLSNQSWLGGDELTPVSDMIAWTKSALNRGACMIQYEPVWYWFRVPRGEFSGISQVERQGQARESFAQLNAALE